VNKLSMLPGPPEMKNRKSGSCGTLCPGTTMKIVNVQTGENVTLKGSPGELCIKGPTVIINNYPGYFIFLHKI